MVPKKAFRTDYYDPDKSRYVKYRSIVSSISFDLNKFESEIIYKSKWTHVGGNILRLPPIRRKFSLVNKVMIDGPKNEIRCLSICPKGRYVAMGMNAGVLKVRRLASLGQNDLSLCIQTDDSNEFDNPITSVRFVPTMENILFCSDLSGHIAIFDKGKKHICKHIMCKEDNQINALDVNDSGATIISGGKDAVLRIYDAIVGKMLFCKKPLQNSTPKASHRSRIHCVKFDPENYNVFFSGGLDGYVKIWDLREQESVRTIYGPYLRGDAMDLWGNVLLTGSWRASKALDLWDINSCQLLETLEPSNRDATLNSEFFECVRFFNGGRDGNIILAGGSGSGRFEIHNLAERRVVFAVKVMNSVMSIDSTLSAIVCGGLDGICRVVRYNMIEDD